MPSQHRPPGAFFEPQQLQLFDPLPDGPVSVPSAPPARESELSTNAAAAAANATPTPKPQAPVATAPVAASPAAAFFVPPRHRHPRATREIHFGEHGVAYELRRGRRRTIGFVISAEGLSVSAPRWVGQGEIDAALREKSAWILRKLHEQRERASRVEAARIEWRDGATLPFLGETVTLVIDPRITGQVLNQAEGMLPGVPHLTLHLGLAQEASATQIRDAVQSWLQRQARRVFEERAAVFATRLGVRVRRLSLSSASTRWGSASADGSIRLNWRLVHFALPVIDYVVTHELAHLREMNHGPAFWDVVRQALPDYEQARGVLKTEVLPEFE